ncbi:type II toxin-antitoxin system PemK/MazF family toxin [Pyrococcus horikoshii]|uniref:Type II toxin-antitoxin system PemK/MazF family toxin n=2 Tax=Pyrococcus horikoshii TaxID=53953 RepID=O58914_PYRHO|nr:type II toxin-antitoxin system PemK/MazF family toxin [Pyrococcus horikoshii]BAA30282.1 138aa long hypothetical protein [Pyrococcus horikoshii OT3]HII60196.1 type II toxin-antitoxin system PemK/MazF family toxin [Pyrococcus horikoshii]
MPKQGEIWTAPFPYFDDRGKLTFKIRPTLIVSNDEFNDNALDVIICQISRFEYERILKLPSKMRSKIKIITNNDLDPNTSGKLRNISIIKPYKLFSISKDKLNNYKFIGKLKPKAMSEISLVLKEVFQTENISSQDTP